jgi:hypothetical protein
MKTVNKDAYTIVKKEDISFYDILLCSVCSQSCLRCNYSRHKKSPKHLRELKKLNIPIINQSIVCDEVDDMRGNELDNNTMGMIDPLTLDFC